MMLDDRVAIVTGAGDKTRKTEMRLRTFASLIRVALIAAALSASSAIASHREVAQNPDPISGHWDGSFTLQATPMPRSTATPTPTPVVNGAQPLVSPDGAHIAFLSNRGGSEDLFVINADGTGETQLTH